MILYIYKKLIQRDSIIIELGNLNCGDKIYNSMV